MDSPPDARTLGLTLSIRPSVNAQVIAAGDVPTKRVVINMLKNRAVDNQGKDVLTVLQPKLTSEVSLFVYRISADGTTLTPSSSTLNEAAVISSVHAYAGKKVTWSFGGGAQNVADMESAVTTNVATTVSTIVNKTRQGYDGVKLDIENIDVDATVLPNLVRLLRAEFIAQGMPNALITMDVQPSAWQNVWADIDSVEQGIDHIYVMVYDIPGYTTATIKDRTLKWVEPMNGHKDKISPGLAPQDSLGRVLTLAEFEEICQWVKDNNFAGIMVFSDFYMSDADYWGAIKRFFG